MEQQQIQFNWAAPEGSAEMELKANEARIAELRARLETLGKQGLAGANELDRNLAANRARVGDMGTAQAHLGRIDSRIAQDEMRKMQENLNSLNKIKDVQYRYAQLKNKVDLAETDFANTTPENLRSFRNAEAKVKAAKEELAAFEKQNRAFLFGPEPRERVVFSGTENADWGTDKNQEFSYPETVQQVSTMMNECTMQGKDGQKYLRPGCKAIQEQIIKGAKSLGIGGELTPELQTLINDFEKLQEVPAAKAENTTDNLKLWLAELNNFRNGKFQNGKRKEFQKMYDGLSLEEKQSPEGKEFKNKLDHVLEKAEADRYANDRKEAMDKEGKAQLNRQAIPYGTTKRMFIDMAKTNGFTDEAGRKWTWKNGVWTCPDYKFPKSAESYIVR